MVGEDRIASLEARKRTLVLESSLNRLVLEAEWQNVVAATAWVSSAGRTFRQARPWLLLLAPLAGFLVVRSPGQPRGLAARLLSVVKWIRPLLGIWENG